jgi:hypothetical protein
MSQLTDGNLLPFRQYNESEVINFFSLEGTGLNGQLVAISATGAQDPTLSAGAYRSTAPNFNSYTNVGNYGYGTARKVRPVAAGDNKINTIGVTLHTTALSDENGNPLVNQPYDKTLERGFVQSGFAVPVLTRGLITVKLAGINGSPVPGYAATVSTAGRFGVANPTDIAAVGTGLAVVGKYLSVSGAAFGGYAQIKLEL